MGPRGPSRRQATNVTGPKHVPPDLFGQHFPAGRSIVPRAGGATREHFERWDWPGGLPALLLPAVFSFTIPYFSTGIFHVMSRSYFHRSYFHKISPYAKSTESRRIHFLSFSKMWEMQAACSMLQAPDCCFECNSTRGRGQTP